ncbi:DNA-3-methyladenine glycosylase [Ornithinimicrobium faecis]|uniref:DNA-3-methyladenine glycosylase n=1 Tax=Ornithinimicrobium faecis TaxID=2934158 RepID=UPI002118F715|nr:DNA-3-methyladenine glycosylase [Ornithinimicrobium sp. HY1745]
MVDLSREFLARPAVEVAPALLGAVIEHGDVAVRLTEVEAYAGESDPGSHAFRGPTDRNRVMFGPAGHLYVYFTYGMHTCSNVVCGPDGEAQAVLLRGGEIVRGLERARERRTSARTGQMPVDRDLARGPARLAKALGLTLDDYGTDLLAGGDVVLRKRADGQHAVGDHPGDSGEPAGRPVIRTGPRVGVRGAGGDGTAYPWRFWLDGDPTVSVYRPAAPLRRRG